MTTAEDRENARNHATGEFGPQPHAESGIVPMIAPTPFGDAARDLAAWMDGDSVFAIRLLVGNRAEELLHHVEKSRGSHIIEGPMIDVRVSIAGDGPTVASYMFPDPEPMAAMARGDEVAQALRTIPQARAAMGLSGRGISDSPTDSRRVRIVLVCPTPVEPEPFTEESPEQQLVEGIRPHGDDSVNDLLNDATVTVVADFTPWCPEPNDHCVGGDCYYGNHGPLTAEAENDLRAGGYGWVLDDPEEE